MKSLVSSDGNQRTAQLKKQVSTLKGREDRALSYMLDMPESREELKLAYQQARGERVRVEGELAEKERQERDAVGVLATIDSVAHDIAGVVPSLDQQQRQEFLRRVIEKVTWDGTEAEIVCFLAQNSTDRAHDWPTRFG